MTDKLRTTPENVVIRLRELVKAITGDRAMNWTSEFSLRIPVDPARDADCIMSQAAELIESIDRDHIRRDEVREKIISGMVHRKGPEETPWEDGWKHYGCYFEMNKRPNAALYGMVDDLPRVMDNGWTQATRDEFLRVFAVVLNYYYPVPEGEKPEPLVRNESPINSH